MLFNILVLVSDAATCIAQPVIVVRLPQPLSLPTIIYPYSVLQISRFLFLTINIGHIYQDNIPNTAFKIPHRHFIQDRK